MESEKPPTPEWCLLCFSPMSASEAAPPSQSFFDIKLERAGKSHKCQLSKELDVIFVLKNCLELPTERLSYYLYRWGSPQNWVSLCSKCMEVVKDAKRIHTEIFQLQKTFDAVKAKLAEIVRESGKLEVITRESKQYKKQPKDNKKAMEITELTRGFVKKHEFQSMANPFRSGDLKAVELLRKQNLAISKGPGAADDDDLDAFLDIPNDDDGMLSDAVETSSCSSDSDLDDDSNSSDDGSGSDVEAERELKQRMLVREGKGKKPSQEEDDGLIKCRTCNKQFGTTELRDAHEQVHKNEEANLRHKCPFCPLGFTRLDYFRIHMRSHKIQDKPKITKEDRKFAKAQEKERKKQEKMRKYPCTECEEAFPKLKLLEKHLVDDHEGALVPVVCDICGKSFARELSLRKHVKKVHETERKYNLHCIQCGMGMKTAGKLKRHLKEAHNILEMGHYVCQVEGCKKKCRLKVDFEVHMAKHMGNAPYQCDLCGKHFWQSQQIRKHNIVMHSGNRESKPFKCDICQKGFAIKHYVYTHKRKVHFKKPKAQFPYYGEGEGDGSSVGEGASRQLVGHVMGQGPDHDYGQYGEPSNHSSSSFHMM